MLLERKWIIKMYSRTNVEMKEIQKKQRKLISNFFSNVNLDRCHQKFSEDYLINLIASKQLNEFQTSCLLEELSKLERQGDTNMIINCFKLSNNKNDHKGIKSSNQKQKHFKSSFQDISYLKNYNDKVQKLIEGLNGKSSKKQYLLDIKKASPKQFDKIIQLKGKRQYNKKCSKIKQDQTTEIKAINCNKCEESRDIQFKDYMYKPQQNIKQETYDQCGSFNSSIYLDSIHDNDQEFKFSGEDEESIQPFQYISSPKQKTQTEDNLCSYFSDQTQIKNHEECQLDFNEIVKEITVQMKTNKNLLKECIDLQEFQQNLKRLRGVYKEDELQSPFCVKKKKLISYI